MSESTEINKSNLLTAWLKSAREYHGVLSLGDFLHSVAVLQAITISMSEAPREIAEGLAENTAYWTMDILDAIANGEMLSDATEGDAA